MNETSLSETRKIAKLDKKNPELCNNCGKYGHVYKMCKVPITSFGVIVFRVNQGRREYLMIRRKDTLGYIDFMRGKYGVNDFHYILNMVKQMTVRERQGLLDYSFDTLWNMLWHGTEVSSVSPSVGEGETPEASSAPPPVPNSTETSNGADTSHGAETLPGWLRLRNTPSTVPEGRQDVVVTEASKQFKSEEFGAKYKFNCLKANGTLADLIERSRDETWDEPEWGFPKGRRNYQEKDYECALREMTEETGYDVSTMKNIKNVLPYEEIFLGSNYKSYKHKYYLMYMDYADSIRPSTYDTSEVSAMEWKTFDACMQVIRPYNVDKIRILSQIESLLDKWV